MKMKFDISCGQSVTSHKSLSLAWFLNGKIMYFKILSAANLYCTLKVSWKKTFVAFPGQ